MTRLDEKLDRAVGGKAAKVLAKLGLETVDDLLRHYPRRYADRGELTDLATLEVGDDVTVMAEVARASSRRMKTRRGSVVEVTVTDGKGFLDLTFFNQPWRAQKDLVPGVRGMFAGQVGEYRQRRQLIHPEFLVIGKDSERDIDEFAGGLITIYPAKKDVTSWDITRSVRVVLDTLGDIDDPLPQSVLRRHKLMPLVEALRAIHRPRTREEAYRARKRFTWEEAFVLQVALAQRRREALALPATPRIPREDGLLAQFDDRLPFELTDGQRAVSKDVAADLAQDHPMHRLLQGEVGSGKTVVALRAMLSVVDTGGQAALLAPTEVLAQQHYRSLTTMLGPLADAGRLGGADDATRVALLTGSQGAAGRREALLAAASGEAGIVVGTHALLQDPVQFADLGLIVVDEQHRFGVEQRDALRAKADQPPHLLVMTATPIPRTVAMTVFGDLEVSTLSELPHGRQPIATHVVPVDEKPHYLDRAWVRVREEATSGHGVYVVCPRIGDGAEADGDLAAPADNADERRPPLAVLDVAPMLAQGPLAGLCVEVLHGRMAPDAKDTVMRRFSAGEVDVLVATTVVEVGVDVPNATMMVVMDADRFGVSQLHQLRGRVGRGTSAGICLLVTDMPAGSPARARLDAVAASQDGFELSRVDLEQRREGDVLGANQSGRRSSLRLLGVIRDEDVIHAARDEAIAVVNADPELLDAPALRRELEALLEAQRASYLDKT
jgi:ATP-dependent DNA helicase RecG